MKKFLIIIVALLISAYILIKLNDNFLLLWNSNKVVVQAENPLNKENVKIEFGSSVNTLNRVNDEEVFTERDKYSIIYDGRNTNKISNEYGENDFLITYNNEHYLSFRHFKSNRRHQHKYEFIFQQVDSNIFVEVAIQGEDVARFKERMLWIKDAQYYVRNTPIDNIQEVHNVVDLKNQKELFNLPKFKNDIDSFLIKFTGIKYAYNLTIDTINKDLNRKILYDTNLLKYLTSNSKYFIHYSFDDKKSIENLDFRIIEIQFVDSTQCNRVFKKLDLYANTKSAIDSFDYIPCLTYQNDRLLKGKKTIYWLDNNCTFSFKTHKAYLKNLRKSLNNFQPNDSIVCKCGGVTSIK